MIDVEAVRDWLQGRDRILLVTHQRPDGDALGSLFGLHHCLESAGVTSIPYINESVPDRYRSYAPDALIEQAAVDLDSVEAIICLDCANVARLSLPNGLCFDDITLPSCSIDHHVDNPGYGDVSLVVSDCAATAEILGLLARQNVLNIPSEAATALLIGVVTDTGGFRFANTSPTTLDTAGWLQSQGAEYDRVMSDVFFSEPIGLLRLQAEVFQNMRFAYNGRLAYFFLTTEMLEAHGVNSQDTEDVIETARVIAGAEIVCRMQAVDGGVRYSLRSKRTDLPIIDIAHKLGGGGHKMAAGAFSKDITLDAAEQLVLRYTAEQLGVPPQASDDRID